MEIYFKCERSFGRLSNAGLKIKAQAVESGLETNSTLFPNPTPTLEVFHSDRVLGVTTEKDMNDAYNLYITRKVVNDKAKATIVKNLGTVADYVDSVALGDEEIVLFSGNSSVNNEKHKHPIPESVTGLRAKISTDAGVVKLDWDLNDLATIYKIEKSITPTIPSSYLPLDSTVNISIELKGLPSGVLTGFRVKASNAAGNSNVAMMTMVIVP